VKAREAHQLSTDELGDKLRESYQELFNLRFQKANRELTNFSRIGQVKKDIARFKTVLRERELGLTTPVAPDDQAERG
jgi:large subunit ribosomal protein L29